MASVFNMSGERCFFFKCDSFREIYFTVSIKEKSIKKDVFSNEKIKKNKIMQYKV